MIPCRTAAAAEPLPGTAPRARSWWLLEVPGAWGRQAVAECRVPQVAALRSDDDRRVLLVRRTGRHPAAPQQDVVRAWIAPGAGGALRSLVIPAECIPLLDAEPDAPEWDVQEDADAPRLLVCANAARDACCGLQGRSLLKDLDDIPGVWECSHLGGHRFAPTALQVRQGMVYGRLTAEAARDVTTGERVHARWSGHMRGSPGLSPELQAAQIEILRSQGSLPTSLEAQEGSVRFAIGGAAGWAHVESLAVGEWPVSCGGPAEPATSWHVSVSLD